MEKELKKLSRRELVDIIYQMKKNEQQMQEEIALLRNELEDKRIRISSAGSIAEASANITEIFSCAQRAADLYLNEIIAMKEDTEKACAAMLEDAKKKADGILSERQNRPLEAENTDAEKEKSKSCEGVENV